MENLPVEVAPEPRVVEGRIVGLDDRPPAWRRLLNRLALSAFLACLGLVLFLVGALLAISIIGASIGIPLLLLGLVVLVLAAFLAVGGVKVEAQGRLRV